MKKAMQAGLTVAVGWLAVAPIGAAVTVNSIAGLGLRGVASETGEWLREGASVWVGTFASGFDAQANAKDPVALASAWRRFATTTTRVILNDPGRFAAASHGTDPALAGHRIYWWINRTLDRNAPWPDLGNITAYGLYSSTAANWVFPAPDAIPPLNLRTITSSEVDLAYHGTIEVGGLRLAAVGTAGPLRIESWRTAWFGTRSSAPEAADGADPDGDGIVNLAEYGFGTNPVERNDLSLAMRLEADDHGRNLVLAIGWRGNRVDAELVVQSSVDLRHWVPETGAGWREAQGGGPRNTVEVWLPLLSESAFYQVQVQRAGTPSP